LKEKSYFDKVNDSANGLYFIENMTNPLAEKSWGLFKNIEKQGGYISAIENSFMKNEVKKSANRLIENTIMEK